MSLDVFLSFMGCPKHPDIPHFDVGIPVAYFGNLIQGRYDEIYGDINEIDLRFCGVANILLLT